VTAKNLQRSILIAADIRMKKEHSIDLVEYQNNHLSSIQHQSIEI
jgi:hypothetical protein